MKLHVPATNAFPVALAAASITLSLLLIPGGGASLRSSGVAPALRLVAGEVATVVQKPQHDGTSAQHKAAAPPARVVVKTPQVGARPTHHPSSQPQTASVPAHRSVGHRTVSTPPPRAVVKRPVTVPTVVRAQPITPAARHGHGKALGHAKKARPPAIANPAVHAAAPAKSHGRAKALGHAKKAKAVRHAKKTTPPAATNAAAQPAAPAKGGHGHGHGSAAAASAVPPAVPPGHARGGKK